VKALMALVVFALAAVLAWQWRDWPPPVPGPGAAGSQPPTVELASQPAEETIDRFAPPKDKEEYLNVTERPLFLPDRRPPSEEPEEEEALADSEEPSELARLDLNAILLTPSESLAWVRDLEKKDLIRLHPGDELKGWSVKEILSDRVLLERQGKKDTLVLRDYKNMPPPAHPRRTPLARRKAPSPVVRRKQEPRAAVEPTLQTANGLPLAQQPNRKQPIKNPPDDERPATGTAPARERSSREPSGGKLSSGTMTHAPR
jgi:general secretion pathway protein N